MILLQSPQELVPFNQKYGVQDWDDASGAIEWPRLAAFLGEVKRLGMLPDSHKSHDHLNDNKPVPVSDSIISRWRIQSENMVKERLEKHGERLVWAIVDGFLMYWDQRVIDELDIRIFLRVPHAVLKQRRHERHGYHTAEGSLWRDPPNYWENIVYPAYVRAHAEVFEGGDVEKGRPTDKVPGLILFEGLEVDMKDMVSEAMEVILEKSQRSG